MSSPFSEADGDRRRLRLPKRAAVAAFAAAVLAGLAGGVRGAAAEVPMTGSFRAEARCFATPSVRGERNPGAVAVEPGEIYELLARNAVPGSHYLIRVPGARPERRWVAYGCGATGEGPTVGKAGREPRGAPSATAPTPIQTFVLAAGWHAAFCETRPRAADCRAGGTASGFVLHGLWPQPEERQYCGVPARLVAADRRGDWSALPDVRLSQATARALASAMPGVRAGLDRHQWWKHGTCFPGDAEAYFGASLRVLADLNASGVRDLFVNAVGSPLKGADVRQAFDEAFGRGAGGRVLVDCVEDGDRRLVAELRIALSGDLTRPAPLAGLIRAAPEGGRGCRDGIVDPAGFR